MGRSDHLDTKYQSQLQPLYTSLSLRNHNKIDILLKDSMRSSTYNLFDDQWLGWREYIFFLIVIKKATSTHLCQVTKYTFFFYPLTHQMLTYFNLVFRIYINLSQVLYMRRNFNYILWWSFFLINYLSQSDF